MNKLTLAVISLALITGTAKQGVAADTFRLPDNKDSKFLSQMEISKAIEQLANLEYPATQSEVATKLGYSKPKASRPWNRRRAGKGSRRLKRISAI